LPQRAKAPRRVTNVRNDKFWRAVFGAARSKNGAACNGDVKPATWHWFALRGSDDGPMFAFPGIWRRSQSPIRKDGPKVDIEVYGFLTTTPNKLVATINHERMPVLLTREEEFDMWLNGAPYVAFALAPGQMWIVQEGFKKQASSMLPRSAVGSL